MYKYQIQVEADFIAQANSPSQLRERLIRIFKNEEFDDKSFEIKISQIKKEKKEVKQNVGNRTMDKRSKGKRRLHKNAKN